MSDDVKTKAALERAQQLFKQYYASCFWHWKPDLVVNEPMIPLIVKGLCAHGGQKGMLAAAELQRPEEK
jgi:hypothetical protein